MSNGVNKAIIILIILGILLPNFSLAQEEISPPKTLEEAKEIGEEAFEVSKKKLPGILEKIWKEKVLSFWKKMWDWFKINIWSKIEGWFKKIESRTKEEIEKRKPIIKEEFKKEKEELKEEILRVKKSLWKKFKELIK